MLGVQNENFWAQLQLREVELSREKPTDDSDVVFFSAQTKEDLQDVEVLKSCIKKNGFIWVIWPKGQKHIKEGDIRSAAKGAGLVDVKVVSFSDTHSGLKLMIPLNLR